MSLFNDASPTLMLTTSKSPSLTFKDAFAKVLLDRVGIVMTDAPLMQGRMRRELDYAQRLDGFAGDAPAGGHLPDALPTEDGIDDSSDDEVSGGVQGRQQWSEDAEELKGLVRKLGPRNPGLTSQAFMRPFFRDLRLPGESIALLDPSIESFSRLTFLDVSRNKLESLDCLPPNLQFLKAYNTRISRIFCEPSASLVFLGVGHSSMGEDGLTDVAERFPALLSLDVCFTNIRQIGVVGSNLLPGTPKLRQLCLAGSPVALLPHYRLRLLRWAPRLQVLDGSVVSEKELADALRFSSTLDASEQRPESLRIAVLPRQIHGVYSLLHAASESVLSERRAVVEAARATWEAEKAARGEVGEDGDGAPPPQDEEEKDPVVDACAGGSLWLRFELPNGLEVSTTEIQLPLEVEAVPPAEDGTPGRVFDSFDLSTLKTAAGEQPYFDTHIGEGGVLGNEDGEDGLAKLCTWLKAGMALRLFFQARAPTHPAAVVEVPKVDDKKGGKKAPPKSPSPPQSPELDSIPKLPRPPEIPVGGVRVPLHSFVWPAPGQGMPEGASETGELPTEAVPWPCQQSLRLLPMSCWLDPRVQVPPIEWACGQNDGDSDTCVHVRNCPPGVKREQFLNKLSHIERALVCKKYSWDASVDSANFAILKAKSEAAAQEAQKELAGPLWANSQYRLYPEVISEDAAKSLEPAAHLNVEVVLHAGEAPPIEEAEEAEPPPDKAKKR